MRLCVLVGMFLCATVVPACAAERFIDVTVPFAPGARVVSGVQEGAVGEIKFSIYPDGSAHFGRYAPNRVRGWTLRCEIDAMDDTRWCLLYKGDLWVWVYDSGRRAVHVGVDHYPGSEVKVRIDKGAVHSAREDGWWGKSAVDLIAKIRAGRTLTTRYVEWPYNTNQDRTIEVLGFGAAYDYAEWAVAGQPRR